MKPVDFLQGKWLGHPLHPALVHVPVGGWFVACCLDVVAWVQTGSGVLPRVALWCVGAGLVGALLAVPTGIADWSGIKKEKPAWKLGVYHMGINLVATLVWAVNFGLRWRAGSDVAPTPAILVTSASGTLLVLIGGYLGSLLVFEHGIAVARQSKKAWREIAERGGARLPPAAEGRK